MHRNWIKLGVIAVLTAATSAAVADTIDVGKEGSKLTRKGITIRGVTGDQLVFTSESGNDTQTPLSNVIRIEVQGETAFNDAETAYANQKWTDAATGYTKAVQSASKPWIKDRSSLRLVDLAGKTGRFDAAAAGYVALLASNPSLADTVKPAIPADGDKSQLTAAASAADKALSGPNLTPQSKLALLQFELQIDNALGDKQASGDVVEQILKSGALNPDDPATAKQYASFKIAVAQMALDSKDYAKAKSQIEDGRRNITDPDDQAAALYILAEVQYQQDLSKGVTDKAAWQDAAIAFMKVVGVFPSSAQAPDALGRTAACYEQMKDLDKAASLYGSVVSQYAGSPAAKTAQAALDRIKASK